MSQFLEFTNKVFENVKLITISCIEICNIEKLTKEINNNIYLSFKDKSDQHFNKIEYIIDFFKMPQNKDVLQNSLAYLLVCNLLKIEVDKSLWGHVYKNYLKIINDNFTEINNTETINSLDILLSKFKDIVQTKYSNEIVDERVFETPQLIDILTKFKEHKKDLVLNALSTEFVVRNSKYEIEKERYNKLLKQINSSGFIYLLGEYKFNDFYISPILLQTNGNDISIHLNTFSEDSIRALREQWYSIFSNNNIVYVVGGAGYGKSLFLKNLLNNYSKLQGIDSTDYLVIYCDLKSYYNNDDAKKTIIDFLTESLINHTGIDGITKEFITYYINIGRCLVLFDALDEVPKDKRNSLHNKITAFFQCNNPNNKVCITSRDRGFIPKNDICVYQIIPLLKQDISDYLDKMIQLKKFKFTDKEEFMNQAEVLIEKRFLNNFLILSLLVNIFKAEQKLPQNKIELYRKCFEFIAKKREEEKSKIGYDWVKIFPLMKDNTFIKLSKLAAPNNKNIKRSEIEELLLSQYSKKYTNEVEAEFAINQFLDFCSNRTELFVPSSVDDEFKFFHRSFFEYFYSQYIIQNNNVEEIYQLLNEFDIDSEVFELTTALLKEVNEERYQALTEYVFNKIKTETDPTKPFCMLSLSMSVIDDAVYIRDYINVFIERFDLIDYERLSQIDSLYLCNLFFNSVRMHPQNKEEFENCILKDFIDYHLNRFLLTFSSIGNYKNHFSITQEQYKIRHLNRRIPYYIYYFDRTLNMRELFERCLKNDKLLKMIASEKNSKDRRRISRAIKAYNVISSEDNKKLYWDNICVTRVEE